MPAVSDWACSSLARRSFRSGCTREPDAMLGFFTRLFLLDTFASNIYLSTDLCNDASPHRCTIERVIARCSPNATGLFYSWLSHRLGLHSRRLTTGIWESAGAVVRKLNLRIRKMMEFLVFYEEQTKRDRLIAHSSAGVGGYGQCVITRVIGHCARFVSGISFYNFIKLYEKSYNNRNLHLL
jgi:hypothetical protein